MENKAESIEHRHPLWQFDWYIFATFFAARDPKVREKKPEIFRL